MERNLQTVFSGHGQNRANHLTKYMTDNYTIINIRDGQAFYYTLKKDWSRNPSDAGEFTYEQCSEFRKLFKKSGVGALLVRYPATESLGMTHDKDYLDYLVAKENRKMMRQSQPEIKDRKGKVS